MDPKPRPNHARYLQILRTMSPQNRLRKAFELSRFARDLAVAGLRARHPEASEEDLRTMLLERLARWHSRSS